MRKVLLLVVLLVTSTVVAQDWRKRTRDFDAALASHDLGQWARSIATLRGQDHPAAADYILRFYAEQVRYEGEWELGRNPPHVRLVLRDPRALYGGMLKPMRNVRSIRFLLDRVDDEDEVVADIVTESLAGNPRLHVVDELLRERLGKAIVAGAEPGARRHLILLRDRFHVLDRDFVRDLAVRKVLSKPLRLALLAAFVDPEFRREIHRKNGKGALFTVTELDAAIGSASRLDQVLAGAGEVEEVVKRHEEAGDLDPMRWELDALRLPHLEDSLLVAYARRLRVVLTSKPLANLPRLHDRFVAQRMARSYRRDVYFLPRHQRQKWDRRSEPGPAAPTTAVDLTEAETRAAVRGCRFLRTLLSERRAKGSAPVVGTPWHRDLFALNDGGRRDVETVAFTPAEREWRRIRDEVMKGNETAVVATEIERKNARFTNLYRLSYELLPLRIDPDLTKAARTHSRFQHRVGQMAHVFRHIREPGGRTAFDRMKKAGYPAKYAGGENVAFGYRDPMKVFDGWRRSPGHRATMLTPAWTEIGVGESGGYWTQNFGTEPYSEDH